MVTEQTESERGPLSSAEAAFRQHLADTIMMYATRNGELMDSHAYRQVAAVTGRTLVTVRNWLMHRSFFPDVPTLARICYHWGIPPEALFPPQFRASLLGTQVPPTASASPLDAPHRVTGVDQPLISLYGALDKAILDKVLSRYTDHPRNTILVRYPMTDMVDQIRPGELIVVDPTVEHIDGTGMYYLRFTSSAGVDKTCVRMAEPLMSSPAVRLSCGSMQPTSIETLELVNGALPPGVTVLGRVIAVVRQT